MPAALRCVVVFSSVYGPNQPVPRAISRKCLSPHASNDDPNSCAAPPRHTLPPVQPCRERHAHQQAVVPPAHRRLLAPGGLAAFPGVSPKSMAGGASPGYA